MGKINMKKFQRGIAFVLSLCMCLSLMSLSAFAKDTGNENGASATEAVAEVNGTKYTALATAVEAVQDGQTVTLLADYELPETLVVNNGKTFTLDLNGKTLTGLGNKKLLVLRKANLTLTDNGAAKGAFNGRIDVCGGDSSYDGKAYNSLTIDSSATLKNKTETYAYTITLWTDTHDSKVDSVAYGTTIDIFGTVNGYIWVQGRIRNGGDSIINVKNGAKIFGGTSDAKGDVGIALNGIATVNIEDGAYVEADNAVEVRAGTLNVGGGTIKSTHQGEVTIGSNKSGTTTSGVGIALSQHVTELDTQVNISGGTVIGGVAMSIANPEQNNEGTITVDVTGGTFEGEVRAIYAVNDANKELRVNDSTGRFISGGTFSVKPDDKYLAKGYEAVESNGKYVVGEKVIEYVAQIGEKQYETFADAVKAAQANDTITLTQDCETGSKYTIAEPLYLTAKGATLDLNKKTITVTKNFSFLIQGDGITVKNGLIRAGSNSEKDTGINSYGLVVNGCDGVTIDGVTSVGGFSIGGDGDKGGTPDAAAATNVTIKNCTVTSGDYYAVCAQQNSTVTIESGVYTADSRSADSGVIQGTFKGSDGPKGTVTVTGGTFNGQIKNNDKGDIVIKGGTFNVDPSAYVPTEGYAAIEVETGKTWQVGEVKENNDGTTTTTATDTQTKVENGETLTTKTETVVVKNTDNSTTTAQAAETRDAGGNLKQTTYSAVEKDSSGNVTANVTATVESTKAPTAGKPSDALKSNNDADALAQRASNGIDPTNLDLTTDLMQSKAKEFADEAHAELKQQQSQGGTVTNVDVKVDVTIKTTLTNYTVGSGDQSVTYNVSPILLAQVTVGSNAPVEKEKPIGNDKLKGSIPVRLPIPDSFATAVAGATTVQIKHIHGDGTSEIITGTIGGTTGGYYVDFSVTGFSSFQILPAGKSFPAPSTNTTTSGSGWSGWSGIGGGYSGSSNNGNSGNNAAQPNSQPVTIDEGGVPLSEFPLMFADVAENAWYRNAIAYVFREGLMKGVSDTKFGPADDTTRGMVSLILMRLADGEAPQTAITFSDVAIESWYADAASWAEMNKIFTGYADGTFRGDVAITREQLATVLYRYAAFCGLTLAEGADISAFGDKDAVSGYAVDAMRWAVAVGLFKGDDRGMLNPANHATRAELATVLMRFADLFA